MGACYTRPRWPRMSVLRISSDFEPPGKIGEAVSLVNAHAPDGKRSETPFNGIGDVFVTLTDERVATWTHAHGASFEQAALVIEAREDEITTLKQQVAELKQQLSSGGTGSSGGDDVAVDAVKALAIALAMVGKG